MKGLFLHPCQPPELTEVAGTKLLKYHQKLFGAFISTKSQQAVSAEGKADQWHITISEDQDQQSPLKTAKSDKEPQGYTALSTVCRAIFISF